jgi:hypothetical protein
LSLGLKTFPKDKVLPSSFSLSQFFQDDHFDQAIMTKGILDAEQFGSDPITHLC